MIISTAKSIGETLTKLRMCATVWIKEKTTIAQATCSASSAAVALPAMRLTVK